MVSRCDVFLTIPGSQSMPITIAAAQSTSVKADVEQNVQIHIRFIRHAARNNVRLIVFPELSLTGYEPALELDGPPGLKVYTSPITRYSP